MSTLAVRSSLAVASHRPSGLNTTARVRFVVAADRAEELASPCIPDPEGPLPTPRGQEPAIRAERHARRRLVVSGESADFSAIGRVPNDCAPVFAAGKEVTAVGAK